MTQPSDKKPGPEPRTENMEEGAAGDRVNGKKNEKEIEPETGPEKKTTDTHQHSIGRPRQGTGNTTTADKREAVAGRASARTHPKEKGAPAPGTTTHTRASTPEQTTNVEGAPAPEKTNHQTTMTAVPDARPHRIRRRHRTDPATPPAQTHESSGTPSEP